MVVIAGDYILPLSDPRASLEVVGGKGASLARLVLAGLPVPAGFHVTTAAYRRFVDENNLQGRILQALLPVASDDPVSFDRAAQAIASLFQAGRVPDEVSRAVLEAYASLPGSLLPSAPPIAVAVRSSATAEDLPELSFAGQQETYLNIRDGKAVVAAVQRCWASLWTGRAISYRAQHDIDPASIALAVVVQTLVPADAAGVLFTANPLNGRRDQVVINAAWGLGEAIVSGQVTPDTLIVDRTTEKVVSRETPEKKVMTVLTLTGTDEQPTPEALRSAPVLDDSAALELVHLGERIESLYGAPMDIEWAHLNGQFTILQARPVTALPEPEPALPVEWKLPDPKGKYMRAGVIELLPDPLTPLFASLGIEAYNQGMLWLSDRMFKVKNAFPENLVTQINGFGYYNAQFTARQMLLWTVILPFHIWPVLRTAEARWKDEARPAYAQTIERWKASDLTRTPAKEMLRGVDEILTAAMNHYASIQGGILPASYISETVFTQFYEKLVRKADDPPALTFMLGFDSFPIRAEKSLYDLAQWSRTRPALVNYLAKTASSSIAVQLKHHTPPEGITAEDWGEFRQRFTTHLDCFGHAIYDLDFANPVAADDPAPLIDTLKHLMQGLGTNPYLRQGEATERRETATRQMEGQIKGLKLRWFRRLRTWAQRFAPQREDALGDIGLGWPLLRQILTELGFRLLATGAISRAEDVFWLTGTELNQLAGELDEQTPAIVQAGLANFSQAIEERKARWKAARRLLPPPVLPKKSKWAGLDLEHFSPAKAGEQAGDTIQGIGASPGQVTATARVLHGPEDFGQMQPGDVLVAAITTPAWTPLFALASGVVTDVGGPLSHSSIVAREYGIPAVLGTGVATHRIHTGQRVEVDGSKGVVKLLP